MKLWRRHRKPDIVEYREILAGIPRPSTGQIDAFVEYVCDAHSWYKHLPVWPPGTPFQFYVSPHAGCDLLIGAGGRTTPIERTEDQHGIHYSWKPTNVYRAEFGYLEYQTHSGSRVGVSTSAGLVAFEQMSGAIYDRHGIERLLPPEIQEAGSVHLTAFIHPHMESPDFWKYHKIGQRPDGQWAPEMSRDDTLKAIMQLLSIKVTDENHDELEQSMKTLVETERDRLQSEMKAAITLVLEIVYQ
jgi:hypothetical protein